MRRSCNPTDGNAFFLTLKGLELEAGVARHNPNASQMYD